MNERQRLAGRSAQQKIVHWLLNLDVSRLTPTEAARWWEVAVRVERQAAGADLPMSDLPEMPPEDTPDEYAGLTLGDVLNGTHTPDEVLDLAENLHRAIDS